MSTAVLDSPETDLREGKRADIAPDFNLRQTDTGNVVVEITNDQLDRHGTKIEPDGARLEDYKKNPVVLWRHGFGMEGVPIGKTVNIQVRGNSIFAEVEFDQDDEFARKIERKVRNEFINAASIGFIPHTINREDDDPVIAEWSLLEWSFVGVPSNPDALVSEREMEVFGPVVRDVARQVLAEEMGVGGEYRIVVDGENIAGNITDLRKNITDLGEGSEESEEAGDQREKDQEESSLHARVDVDTGPLREAIEKMQVLAGELREAIEAGASGEDIQTILNEHEIPEVSERSAPEASTSTVADSPTDEDEREAADEAAERSSEPVADEAASEDRPKLVRLKLSDMKAMAREAHRRRERRADRMADDIFKRITGKA